MHYHHYCMSHLHRHLCCLLACDYLAGLRSLPRSYPPPSCPRCRLRFHRRSSAQKAAGAAQPRWRAAGRHLPFGSTAHTLPQTQLTKPSLVTHASRQSSTYRRPNSCRHCQSVHPPASRGRQTPNATHETGQRQRSCRTKACVSSLENAHHASSTLA